MRLPFLGNKSQKPDDAPLRLMLAGFLEIQYVIYFRRQGAALPTSADVRDVVLQWLQTHAGPPLKDMVTQWLDSGLMMYNITPSAQLPPPPLDFLRAFGLDETLEQRLAGIDSVIVVRSQDRLQYPRVGLWAALAAARALAQALGGVTLDPATRRVMQLASFDKPLPTENLLPLSEHAVVYSSTDERGLAYFTLEGMSKFGLPNLELRDAPPGLMSKIAPILYGMGSLLAFRTMEHLDGLSERERNASWKRPITFEIAPQVGLTDAHITYAMGGEQPSSATGAARWSEARLLPTPPLQNGQPALLRVAPPREYTGPMGEWLYGLLAVLSKTEDVTQQVRGDNELVEEAHRRALAELPHIKKRFQTGLQPGETLYVKQGFPVAGGTNEYLWIAVNTWQGDRLGGQISNAPQMRPDLRAGQSVQLKDDDIFDWMLRLPSGAMEGAYTTHALMREAGQ